MKATAGWLEHRHLSADSSDDFVARMYSVELTTALAAWAMAVPGDIRTPEHARFALASVLSVARLPWLWGAGDSGKIAAKLTEILANTTKLSVVEAISWKDLENKWLRMIRRGYALRTGHLLRQVNEVLSHTEWVSGFTEKMFNQITIIKIFSPQK